MSQWTRIESRNTNQMLTAAKNTIMKMVERIIVRSPVDTGRFRNNWFTSINVQNTSVTNRRSGLAFGQSGGVRMREAFSTIRSMNIGDTLYFTNNLHYAVKLEHGGSWRMAPSGMVRVTLADFQGTLDRVIRVRVILN